MGCWTVVVLVLNGFSWVGAGQLYTATGGPSRVCPCPHRVLAMHRGVGGVLGPFTCGFRAGEDGERVGVSEAGVAAAGKVSRAARWQRLSAERLDALLD